MQFIVLFLYFNLAQQPAMTPWERQELTSLDQNRAILNVLRLPDPPKQPPQAGVISVARLTHKVPKKAHAHLDRAIKLSQQGKHAESVVELEKATVIDPEFAEAQNNLAVEYFMLGRETEAEALWRRAIALDPAFVAPHVSLGNLALLRKDLPTAEKEARRALTLSPNSADGRQLWDLINSLR